MNLKNVFKKSWYLVSEIMGMIINQAYISSEIFWNVQLITKQLLQNCKNEKKTNFYNFFGNNLGITFFMMYFSVVLSIYFLLCRYTIFYIKYPIVDDMFDWCRHNFWNIQFYVLTVCCLSTTFCWDFLHLRWVLTFITYTN